MKVSIDGLNGLNHFAFEVGEPGIYVLRGPNGAGKTSAIEAVRRACGDKSARRDLTDGAVKGEARVGGVLLRVGQRQSTTGQLSAHLEDTGSLATLIDPGLKDPDARARARIRALADLVDLDVTPERLDRLSGSVGCDQRISGGTLPEAAAQIKRSLEAQAREREEKARELEATARTLASQIGAVITDAQDVASAERALSTLEREAERLRIEAGAREELEVRQAAVRESLGERPDVVAADEIVVAQASICASLNQQMAEIREALARENELLKQAQAQARSVVAAATDWDRRLEILDQPLTGATREQAADVEQRVTVAQQVAARAREAARQQALVTQIEESTSEAKALEKEGAIYRSAAQGVQARLGDLLAEAGMGGFSIVDGELHYHGKTRLEGQDRFERLSFGQRTRAALGLALVSIQRRGFELPPLLTLDAAFWGALDPERRQELVTISTEAGVTILTEQPDAGELRVEQA